jgi:hypothetical protein
MTETNIVINETDSANNVNAKRQKMTQVPTPIAVIVMNATDDDDGCIIYVNHMGNVNPEMEWILMHMRMGTDPVAYEVFKTFCILVSPDEPNTKKLDRYIRLIATHHEGIDEAFLRRAWTDNRWWVVRDEKEFGAETGAPNTSMRVILADGGGLQAM